MKRLLVFVFTMVFLGSCSKQRTVKFVVELNTTPIVQEWYDCESLSNSNEYQGYTRGELSYSNISWDGVGQSGGLVESTWYSPTYSNSYISTTYMESSPNTMMKGDNIEIYHKVYARCAINESYTFKAVVNDRKEYIIAENVSVNAVNPISENNCLNYIRERTNWIVP